VLGHKKKVGWESDKIGSINDEGRIEHSSLFFSIHSS
jgi:hypothetical protein